MNKHLLVTAGPTREMLDPVRFLSNVSTGEMGYQVAREAKKKGYRVVLVSGPTALTPPAGVHFVPVVSTQEMERAVKHYFPKCDALIMTAAVCDYTPARPHAQKIKRIRQKTVLFKRTNDILKSISSRKGKRIVIGFCLETENLRKNARRKLREKRLNYIAANIYNKSQNPFGKNAASILLIDEFLREQIFPKAGKTELARKLITVLDRELKNHLKVKR